MADLKRSALFEVHGAMKAKMAPLAGWTMPLQYPGGSIPEVLHTRDHCSLFDSSHYGKFRVAGDGAAKALDRLLFYGAAALPELGCRRDLLVGSNGLIISDLTVCRMAADDFFLLTNPVSTAAAAAGLQGSLPPELLTDLTQALAVFDLLGPEAAEVTGFLEIPEENLPEPEKLQITAIDGVNIILCRADNAAGADGFRFIFRRDHAVDLWEMILEYPKVDPAGFNAADILRLETGYPLSAREINPPATPVEAGFITSPDQLREQDFNGRSFLLTAAPRFRTVMAAAECRKAIPGKTPVCSTSREVIGEVIWGAYSPVSNRSIAVCRLNGSDPVPENTPLFFGETEEMTAGKSITTAFGK